MGQCSYCGEEGKMTREHIIPDWYGSANSGNNGEIFVEKAPDKLVGSDPKVKDVCANCNNVILGKLDNYGKGLYERFFKHPVFKAERKALIIDRSIFVRWLMKVAFNSARANRADLHVLDGYAKDIISDFSFDNIVLFCAAIAPSVEGNNEWSMARRSDVKSAIRPNAFRVGVFRLSDYDYYRWSFRYVVIDSYAFYLAIPQRGVDLTEERKCVIKSMIRGSEFGVRVSSDNIKTKQPKYHAMDFTLGHMSNFPTAYGVTQDPWVLLSKPGGMDFIHYVIVRDDIESGDISSVVEFIDQMLTSRESVLSAIGRVVFSVYGYEDDTRELWEIEDVRVFLSALNSARPYWMLFQPPQSGWTQILLACLCRINVVQGGFEFTHHEDYKNLTTQWFSYLNEISNKFAISYEINRELSDRFGAHLKEMLSGQPV